MSIQLMTDSGIIPFAPLERKSRIPDALASQKGSVTLTLVSHYARIIRGKPVSARAAMRHQIVKLLQEAENPDRCIDEFIKICVNEGGPTGFDLAIDVLSEIGGRLLEYAWEYLRRDLQNAESAYEPNDDYWYVLLRSVAKAQVSEKERFRFISCCKRANSRGIREGVVEGFCDLGTPAAVEQIRDFSENDQDDFVRRIAKEALADMES